MSWRPSALTACARCSVHCSGNKKLLLVVLPQLFAKSNSHPLKGASRVAVLRLSSMLRSRAAVRKQSLSCFLDLLLYLSM